MPVIRIDDEVWKALQSLATPFVDAPNDVLRRLLRLNGEPAAPTPQHNAPLTPEEVQDPLDVRTDPTLHSDSRRRRRKLDRTPEKFFRKPILEALLDLGGRAEAAEVLNRVYERTKSELKPDDLELLDDSGEERWRNTARWQRKRMVEEGLLTDNSPYGVWELTEKGREQARRITA